MSNYDSPLYQRAAATAPMAAMPESMQVAPMRAPVAGLFERVKTGLHNSAVAGERDRDLAQHIADRQTALGKQAVDISHEIAKKTLADQSAEILAASDNRLAAKEAGSKTSAFETFAVGMGLQARANAAAMQQTGQAYQQGVLTKEEANVQFVRLQNASRLINESQDRAYVASIEQIERRFGVTRR